MAGFLGCLEYVLEEGPNHDWLQDDAVVALRRGLRRRRRSLFFWRAFTAEAADRRSARLRRPQLRARLRCSPSSSASASTA